MFYKFLFTEIVFTYTDLQILMSECRSVLSLVQRDTGSTMVKVSVKKQNKYSSFLKFIEKTIDSQAQDVFNGF